MHKYYLPCLAACLLAGCSQFTTSKQESAALAAAATTQGDAYVSCVTENALSYSGQNSGEIGTLMTVATAACKPALNSYSSAQTKYLETQVMITKKPLQESIDALNERAKADIAQQLVSRPASASAPAAVAIVPPAASSPVPQATVPATATAGAAGTEWTPRQRIYLDCMADQAQKYSGLNESATVVADVAQSRCRSYQGPSNPALEQEGRAIAMGAVLDAKLAQPGR